MDAVLTALVGAFLGEWGDRAQLFAALLAARTRRPLTVLAGLSAAVLAANLLAGYGAQALGPMMPRDGALLLLGLALGFAGAAGLLPIKAPDWGEGWRVPLLLTAAFCGFLLAFGSRTHFLTFALAVRFDAPWTTAMASTLGSLAAFAPAAVLGAGFAQRVPVAALRLGFAVLLLITGAGVAVAALGLI